MKATLAKKYHKIKLCIALTGIVLDLVFWTGLIVSGGSSAIANYVYHCSSQPLVQFYYFSIGIGIISLLLHLPLSFYSSYLVEHQFLLSNQSLLRWFQEQAKGLLLGILLGGILLTVFYLTLWIYPAWWWIIVWLFILIFSILLGQLAPVLIFPIFYKFKPLENESLKKRIQDLAKNWKLNINGVFQFDLSKNTKKANAAFTGLGKTRRIILGDTLLANFSEEEIETVFAHEIGHYTHRHLLKGVTFNSLISLIGLFTAFHIYQIILSSRQYQSHQLEALPYLGLIFLIYSLITGPLGNYLSRRFEYQADQFAVAATGKGQEFINSLKKLGELNLADETPHPVVEFLFYSHPSIEHRIEKLTGAIQ
jgi:STE24 endopeptidase